MSEAAEKLKPLLAALSADERVEIADYLRSLDDGEDEEFTQEEWEDALVEELNRRMADAAAGKTKPIPHEEVMRQMKEKYG
jgi:putative addiction module component (TIGR02574 family)